jgi:phage terminase large subunit-like protein
MTKNCKLPPEVTEWMDIVENDTYQCCEEQHLLVKMVRRAFATEDIYIDLEQLGHYMDLLRKYVPLEIFPWEKFVIACHDCTYWRDTGLPRWPDLVALIGRGAGKDGMIAIESLCLMSPYNHAREYDVDICANNEEQALRPVEDLVGWMEQPAVKKKLLKFFKWTKERVTCKKTRAVMRGRTNNAKGKDGLRSGIVILNEIHQYENYDNINVFTTGLGKKDHPRRSYYTTDGDVREGPLDDEKADCEAILHGLMDDNGKFPFICKLDSEDEIHDEAAWTKANPSLPYRPSLLAEIRKEYREWKENPGRLSAFKTKRRNLPDNGKDSAAAPWDRIAATNKEIPDLKGWSCTAGIDYSKTTDWMAVNLHFKNGNQRYDINKAWICSASKDIPRIKAPWQQWIKTPYLEYVDDVEIHPEIVANYLREMGSIYNIETVAIDNYRYSLLSDALKKIGFTKENKNLVLVQQRDIIKVVPVIDHCFLQGYFAWGDNPVLRWATNNTKTIRYGRDVGADKGSFVYAKIEGKSRKTDPFMALVASMVPEEKIKVRPIIKNIPVVVI